MTQPFEPVFPLVSVAAIKPACCGRVALALAQEQDRCGGSFVASMERLAFLVNMSPSQTRKHVHALITMGALEVLANAHGGSPMAWPHYRFNTLGLRMLGQQPGRTSDLFNEAPPPQMRFLAESEERVLQQMTMELHGQAGQRSIRFLREVDEGGIAYGWAPLQMLLLPPIAKGAWNGWLNPHAGAPAAARSVYTSPETVKKLQQWAQDTALGRIEFAAKLKTETE